MLQYSLIFSTEAPRAKNCIWGKPVEDGFVLYWLQGGAWKPLKIVEDNDTPSLIDDTVQEAVSAIKGKSTDAKTKLTLYGLKAYIDDAIESITPSTPSTP